MNALMELPRCHRHDTQMEYRPIERQTPEQKWCGDWYDCKEPGCMCSTVVMSPELLEVYRRAGCIRNP